MNYKQPEYTKEEVLKNVKRTSIWALIILILVVLPAEYNIDITWLWKLTWLVKLAENYEPKNNNKLSEDEYQKQKNELFWTTSKEKNEIQSEIKEETNDTTSKNDSPQNSLTRTITIWPKGSKEIKYNMNKWDTMKFSWSSPVELYLDQHWEPTTSEWKEFRPFKSVKTGRYTRDTDTLIAEFTGTHGWYWRNITNKTIEIELTMKGQFTE